MACTNIVAISYTASNVQTQKLHRKNQICADQKRISTYKPNIRKYDHLLSLTSEYSEEKYKFQAKRLKEEVSCMFSKTASPLALLEFIDSIDKLGLSDYFEAETKEALKNLMLMKINYYSSSNEDSYPTPVRFRLLREHDHHASRDMLKDIFGGKGKSMITKASDIETYLELLERSYQPNDERLLSTKNIKSLSSKKKLSNSLNDPLAWRVCYDVRRNICAHEVEYNTNPKLLKLAKLNFNITQATHQKDLKEILRWWKKLRIIEDLNFSRDRIVESFFYAVGIVSGPQHARMRKWLTKVIELVLIIDDVYDIYGSLGEVKQFTRAIEKWDPNEVHWLPESMQICFRALHDTTEQISSDIQEQKGGPSALPYLKQAWLDFCKALLVEATWYHKGHIPTLKEYLDNGWISSCGPLLSIHVIFGLTDRITQETLDLYKDCHGIVYHTSLIIRLCNDLGTSKAELERGDVASSILCYIQQENVADDVAREHIKSIILNSWKKIHYYFNALSKSQQTHVKHIINEARMAHVMYQFGDGFGNQDGETQDQIMFSLFEPIA